jgi:hypothetical protein
MVPTNKNKEMIKRLRLSKLDKYKAPTKTNSKTTQVVVIKIVRLCMVRLLNNLCFNTQIYNPLLSEYKYSDSLFFLLVF